MPRSRGDLRDHPRFCPGSNEPAKVEGYGAVGQCARCGKRLKLGWMKTNSAYPADHLYKEN